jgi:hypothetical protein
MLHMGRAARPTGPKSDAGPGLGMREGANPCSAGGPDRSSTPPQTGR